MNNICPHNDYFLISNLHIVLMLYRAILAYTFY